MGRHSDAEVLGYGILGPLLERGSTSQPNAAGAHGSFLASLPTAGCLVFPWKVVTRPAVLPVEARGISAGDVCMGFPRLQDARNAAWGLAYAGFMVTAPLWTPVPVCRRPSLVNVQGRSPSGPGYGELSFDAYTKVNSACTRAKV
jgi:hypothetical protein